MILHKNSRPPMRPCAVFLAVVFLGYFPFIGVLARIYAVGLNVKNDFSMYNLRDLW